MHRAKEETEGVQKGGEKSEKSENEKDRRRKDALSSARMGEKDMGEVIGGSHLRALVVYRHRNRDGMDQLTLKMGWLGAEEQGKKS